jgi:transcriptional regulator with XRE-family HTH domain
MDDWATIGARIRERREHLDLNQVDVAVAAGMSRTNLAHVEKGKNGVAVEKLALIAAELRVSFAWLIGESVHPRGSDPQRLEWEEAFDRLDPATRKALLVIARSGAPKRRANKGRSPPRPFVGREIEKNRFSAGCPKVVPIQRALRGREE